MFKRLAAVAFIFVCTAIAWGILGATILNRTHSRGNQLRGQVQSIWGVAQTQSAPYGTYSVKAPSELTVVTEGTAKKIVETPKFAHHTIVPSASEIAVKLSLKHRKKGLLWYSTYTVDFQGDYVFQNNDPGPREVQLTLPFPAAQALYDDLQFVVDGQAVRPTVREDRAYVRINMSPQQSAKLRVAYRSQGLDNWRYSFGEKVNTVANFHLRMITDFKDIDFPENTLSPNEKREAGGGWQLDWRYRNLLSGYQIAMAMPEKLQPGPLASEISFFAPVSLFFFFFVLFIVATLKNLEVHPMNYFFIAAAFFAFHLLLAYLVDHLNIYVSFSIASAVSVLLVASYLRIVIGSRFALREAALAQFIYLVLFSFAFFFKGYTGLAITVGAIVTLFVVMQMTGHVRWSERFAAAGPHPLPPARA